MITKADKGKTCVIIYTRDYRSQCLAPSGTSSRDNLRQPMIVPVAVDTVEHCTPDDGRVRRSKHVE